MNKTVLIIEDEETITDISAYALRKEGLIKYTFTTKEVDFVHLGTF